jgi:hypothetical protein
LVKEVEGGRSSPYTAAELGDLKTQPVIFEVEHSERAVADGQE